MVPENRYESLANLRCQSNHIRALCLFYLYACILDINLPGKIKQSVEQPLSILHEIMHIYGLASDQRTCMNCMVWIANVSKMRFERIDVFLNGHALIVQYEGNQIKR